jgi:muramoyltetrapeptide carboxypeptidase
MNYPPKTKAKAKTSARKKPKRGADQKTASALLSSLIGGSTAAPRAVVGVVAPSSPAPLVELQIGAGRVAEAGFEIFLHPQVKQIENFFAGNDNERAHAFLDYAFDPDIGVIWAARGGYGAVRILPLLDEILSKVGKPERKTLVGFSDATVLLEYVRTRWGWRAIHGPMPATFHIERVRGKDWKKFTEMMAGESDGFEFRLKPVSKPSGFKTVSGELVGGNLAMIHSVLGTPYAFDLRDKILFLEEIGEAPYRIDRMMRQLHLAGALAGVKAIVLGTFTDCRDSSPMVYASAARGKSKSKMKPLRKTLTEREGFAAIFGEIAEELMIPVYAGLPVGHGNGTGCLELGRRVKLDANGVFRTSSD